MNSYTLDQELSASLGQHKVLRNTYMLVGIMMTISAAASAASMAMGLSHFAAIMCSIAGFIMLFVIRATANSATGLLAISVFSVLEGLSIGPMLSYYLSTANGGTIVLQALGGTAIAFLALSGVALTSKRDFSNLGGFILVGLIGVIGAMIINIFTQSSALSVVISCCVLLIMSAAILFDTQRIVRGGETNYIMAATTLYLDILNMFIHMLHLLGMFSDE